MGRHACFFLLLLFRACRSFAFRVAFFQSLPHVGLHGSQLAVAPMISRCTISAVDNDGNDVVNERRSHLTRLWMHLRYASVKACPPRFYNSVYKRRRLEKKYKTNSGYNEGGMPKSKHSPWKYLRETLLNIWCGTLRNCRLTFYHSSFKRAQLETYYTVSFSFQDSDRVLRESSLTAWQKKYDKTLAEQDQRLYFLSDDEIDEPIYIGKASVEKMRKRLLVSMLYSMLGKKNPSFTKAPYDYRSAVRYRLTMEDYMEGGFDA